MNSQHGALPVSYTHLDVYKRQAVHSKSLIININCYSSQEYIFCI